MIPAATIVGDVPLFEIVITAVVSTAVHTRLAPKLTAPVLALTSDCCLPPDNEIESAIEHGEPANTNFPLAFPADVGAKRTVACMLSPACKLAGSVGETRLNPAADAAESMRAGQ